MRPIRPVARKHRERGSTAVEFALLLPVFFLVFYAIVTYGLIFAAQQNLTLAATEGARAALNYQVVTSVSTSQTPQQAALGLRANAACTTATNLTTWLKGVHCVALQQYACSYDATMYCVQVTLTYRYAHNPLIPPFPLLGSLLPVPTKLTGTAMIQISPVNII